MLEYETVLKRPDHLQAAGSTRRDIDMILDASRRRNGHRSAFLLRPELSDPTNEMILETATSGEADPIVTLNLTDLKLAAQKFGIRAARRRTAMTILELRP